MLFLLKKIMMPYQDELMCDHHRVTCQIYESRDQSQWLTAASRYLFFCDVPATEISEFNTG